MTKLDSPVTRQLSLVVDGREVDITLVPGDPASLTPDAFEVHLKGLKSSKKVPLPIILKALGYKVEGFKKPEDVRTAFEKLYVGERVPLEDIEAQCHSLEEELRHLCG